MQMRNYFLRLFNKALSLKKHLNQRKPRKKKAWIAQQGMAELARLLLQAATTTRLLIS